MSENVPIIPKTRHWGRRLFIGVLSVLSLFIFLAFALRWWIATDSGARFIETQIESREFGSIKKIEIEGLSGDPLDDFSIDEIKLYDSTGHFATLTDFTMEWSPWGLRKRHLNIESLSLVEADILRRPISDSPQEPKDSGTPFTARLYSADIETLILREPVIGQAATLRLSANGGLFEDGTLTAKLDVVQTDTAGDAIRLDFTRMAGGNIDGTFALNGVPNGTVATLLHAPDDVGVEGQGAIKGTSEAGEGQAVITFGQTQAIDASAKWSSQVVNLETVLNTTDWPLFDHVSQGLGASLNVKAQLDRTQETTPFVLDATAENMTANISGELGEDIGFPETLKFDVMSSELGAVLRLPDGFTLGAGSAKGDITFGDVLSGRAVIDVANITSPYGTAAKISGPVSLSPIGNLLELQATLTALKPVTSMDLPFTLATTASLTAKGAFNAETRRVSKLDVALESAGNRTTAKGELSLDRSAMDISGQAQVSLKDIGAIPSGAMAAKYVLRKTPNSELAISVDGTFAAQAPFAPPFDTLLDDDIQYDAHMTLVDGGLRIRDAFIESGGLKTAISGTVTDRLNLEAEINLSRPVTLAALSVTASSQFSATLTGARADPNLRLDGTIQSVVLGGQTFETVRLRTELTDLVSAPKGPMRITADTAFGPLDLEAQVASSPVGYAVSDLDLTIAELTASGELSFDKENIATGRLVLNLPQDRDRFARAFAVLETVDGEQGVTLEAEAKNIAYGDVAVEQLSAKVTGTLTALSGDISVSGRRTYRLLTREFELNTPLSFTRSPQMGYRLTLKPEADYGRYQIGHTEVLSLEYNEGDLSIDAPMTLNGKPLFVDYVREEASEVLQIRAQNLPINLLSLPGQLSESKGQVSLNLNVREENGQGVSGQGVIEVSDWRGFSVDEGEGFTTTATLDLRPRAVMWQLETADTSQFSLIGNGRLPLISGAHLAQLRPDLTAPMTGELNLSGSAKPLLSLVTVEDAEPDGLIDAELDISGTLGAPKIQGQVSGKALRLELPDFGTRVRDGRFTADFTNNTIAVSDVYIRDSDDGTLEGRGQFKLGAYGRPIGRLDVKAKNFRALDRKDYEGRATGVLYFESDAETSTLGGDVKLNRADVKQFAQGKAAVVEIEVEEINGNMDDIQMDDRPANVPINLNLRVRAPRRIFVRSRGLDVELEADIQLKGTSVAPLLYGTANVIRGGYKIAGKTLDFTEGEITFVGKLADAKVNLKAETDTQNISASVNITGTVQTPEIQLSSTPDRPQDEILSALLFGRSVTELSTIEAAQLAGALAQFSGAGGGFDLVGGLRDALGIGQLSIGVGEDGQAVVSGGRYLAKDVYLQLFRGAGPESTGAVIDWEIRRNLSLRSKIQADSQQSLSLKYKKDF